MSGRSRRLWVATRARLGQREARRADRRRARRAAVSGDVHARRARDRRAVRPRSPASRSMSSRSSAATECWSSGCLTPGCACWRCIPIRSRPRATGSAPRAASLTGSTASCCASSPAPTRHRFRILEPDSDQTKALARVGPRSREDLVAARVALANQLRAELERFWPGPIGLFAALDSPISLAFLERYPSPPTRAGWVRSDSLAS